MINIVSDIDRLILDGLKEDIGSGDITTDLIVGMDTVTVYKNANIVAKEDMLLAGWKVFVRVFTILDNNVQVLKGRIDGDFITKGEIIGIIQGDIKTLLKCERTALNLLQRMCGIATYTHKFVQRLKNTKIRLSDTRKTMPLFRSIDRYAVRIGGGINHRGSLSEGILIKENHIAVAGSITKCINNVRNGSPFLLKIEVEVKSLEELNEALANDVDVIMLDNMEIEDIRKASEIIGDRALIEVSGGVTLENIDSFTNINIDFISAGSLTHSVKAADISLIINAI